MEYTIDELSRKSGLSVDTIRYYQAIGLLPRPRRIGRRALYADSHLERLKEIRAGARAGLPLKVMAAMLKARGSLGPELELYAALSKPRANPRFTARQIARELGVRPELVELAERLGLTYGEPTSGGRMRYSRADLRAARSAKKIFSYGFPVSKLFALAVRHDRAVRATVDQAIELFDRYVRRPKTTNGREDLAAVARAFSELFPAVSSLVAYHFQRVLVQRALSRLKQSAPQATYRLARRTAYQVYAYQI